MVADEFAEDSVDHATAEMLAAAAVVAKTLMQAEPAQELTEELWAACERLERSVAEVRAFREPERAGEASIAQLRDQVDNLQAALLTARRIGAAVGILMFSCKITEAEAFTLLRHVSAHTHRKLRDIADEVVNTGRLPTE